VYRIDKNTGQLSLLAGDELDDVNHYVDGVGSAARFYCVTGVTSDGVNLYLTDINNNNIRKVSISTGQVTTVSASGWLWPRELTTDGESLFVTQQDFSCVSRVQ
jgi:DNA-binding beta-propeller fold protein YncE